MKYDLKELYKLKEEEWLEVQYHPTLSLSIWNYSRQTQFEKNWNETTLNMRGTILDGEGNIIARGFPKFFNYEEHKYEDIPWGDEYVLIQDKADGSLGIIFYYNNDWHVCTRGSFTSDQAIKGKEILLKNYNLNRFQIGFTYLCEIVYPENRIVLDYKGEEKLIFLSILSDTFCKECSWEQAQTLFFMSGISESNITKSTKLIGFRVDELKSRNISNEEGYVLRFYPSGFRMKVKFEEYCRLHSLITHFSNVDIWNCLREGTDFNEFLDKVPDEFDAWVKQNVHDLKMKYIDIENIIKNVYFNYMKSNNFVAVSKKNYAEWVKTQVKKYQSVLFKMYDGKSYEHIIWKYIKPVYSKPFWQKNVED
jgi:RNA ligase